MYKKIFFSVIVFLFVSMLVHAQSLSPTVISPSGNFSSNGGFSLSQTVAEMTMTETFLSGGAILTQGIQQPYYSIVSVPETEKSNYSIDIFPNPGSGIFNVSVNSLMKTSISISVIDVVGRLITTTSATSYMDDHTQSLDLRAESAGKYMVLIKLYDDAGHEVYSQHKILQLIK